MFKFVGIPQDLTPTGNAKLVEYDLLVGWPLGR